MHVFDDETYNFLNKIWYVSLGHKWSLFSTISMCLFWLTRDSLRLASLVSSTVSIKSCTSVPPFATAITLVPKMRAKCCGRLVKQCKHWTCFKPTQFCAWSFIKRNCAAITDDLVLFKYFFEGRRDGGAEVSSATEPEWRIVSWFSLENATFSLLKSNFRFDDSCFKWKLSSFPLKHFVMISRTVACNLVKRACRNRIYTHGSKIWLSDASRNARRSAFKSTWCSFAWLIIRRIWKYKTCVCLIIAVVLQPKKTRTP